MAKQQWESSKGKAFSKKRYLGLRRAKRIRVPDHDKQGLLCGACQAEGAGWELPPREGWSGEGRELALSDE